MQSLDNNTQAFLALVRAGLWEQDVRLLPFGQVDYSEVLRLAEEQSVVGLVTAGIDHVTDVKLPKELALQFAGRSLQIEQRNNAMNMLVAEIVDKLRESGVYTLLVKGQGLAQCYERPLWRTAGDIDLLLSKDNYHAAKKILTPIADDVASEDSVTKHLALVIKGFDVELHGRLPFVLSQRVDNGIDEVLEDLFYQGNVRSWIINNTMVFLPSPNNDVILIFTHFLHHFFIEGVGLRQICDWCRLLWKYRKTINGNLLESRIRKMGLMAEWKAFASLSVDTLGMPMDSMFIYDKRFSRKGELVLKRILECGNFGHNNDLSYRVKYTGMTYKIVATWRRLLDFLSLISIFPVDAPKYYVTYILRKMKL